MPRRTLQPPVLAAAMSSMLYAFPCHSDPCLTQGREPAAPARLTASPAGLGSVPEACPGADAALQGYGAAIVAVDDFYGLLHAGIAPRFRRTLGNGWLSVWLPALEYRFAANATVEASSTDLGPASLGYHISIPVSARLRIAPYARLLHPLDSVYEYAVRYGFDHGVSVLVRTKDWLEWVGGLSFPLYLTANGSTVHESYQPSASLEAVLTPLRPVAFVVGTGARLRAGDDPGFEALDPRVALRLYPYAGARIELGALFPLWGNDRTDIVAGLNLGWIFDP